MSSIRAAASNIRSFRAIIVRRVDLIGSKTRPRAIFRFSIGGVPFGFSAFILSAPSLLMSLAARASLSENRTKPVHIDIGADKITATFAR